MGSILQSNAGQKRIVASALAVCLVVLFYVSSMGETEIQAAGSGRNNNSLNIYLQNASKFDKLWIQQQPLSSFATVVFELQKTNGAVDTTVPTGRHTAHVFFNKQDCLNPRFGVRLQGDKGFLVPVLLVESDSHPKQQWSGSFNIPVEGVYRVEAMWFGCDLEDDQEGIDMITATADATKASVIEFEAVGPTTFPARQFPLSFEHDPRSIGEGATFSDSVWMSTDDMAFVKPKSMEPRTDTNVTVRVTEYTKYLLVDSSINFIPDSSDLMILDDAETNLRTIISRRGTLTSSEKTYQFNEVGNYELVCFFGSGTGKILYDHFMKLLKANMVVSGVRPFKFHYYKVTNLIHPDIDWYHGGKVDKRGTCRKCKHIILSVDELDEGPLSQADFQRQYRTFVKHLQKLMDDVTFPIWLLTNNEAAATASNCLPPYVLPRSTDHPCNDVIKDLVKSGTFENRVNLMDNTDLTLPFFDDKALQHRDQIVANIALRIFVLVGKGVTDWRERGQHAWADGLHRNGTVEPNFKLVPYNWNQTV